MKRYGEEIEMTQDLMDTIATYMDDEKREQVHNEIAPCSPEYFLKRYCKLDDNFENLLKEEFSIELDQGRIFPPLLYTKAIKIDFSLLNYNVDKESRKKKRGANNAEIRFIYSARSFRQQKA